MKRKPEEPINDQEWLNTYADMVTLLLTFFILLFSMSSVDTAKLQALVMAFVERGGMSPVVVSDSIGGGITGDNPQDGLNDGNAAAQQDDTGMPQDMEQLYQYLKSFIEENDLESSVEVSKSNNQVFIRFNNNIFFDADSDFLRNEGKDILNYMGEGFKAVEDQIMMIRVNGHTASVPTDPNYHVNDRILSSDRANAVAIYLEDVKKIQSKKIMSQGYGKNYPVADNDTPEGREQNRRVDIMVLGTSDGGTASTLSTEQLYDILLKEFDVTMENDMANSSDVLIPDSPVGEENETQENGEGDDESQSEAPQFVPPAPDEVVLGPNPEG